MTLNPSLSWLFVFIPVMGALEHGMASASAIVLFAALAIDVYW